MGSSDLKTVCILRRMKREQLSIWVWNAYNPSKGQPEELRFQLLDENERFAGQFTYGRIKVFDGLDISTPWGLARMDWLKGGVRISLNGRELATVRHKALKDYGEFVFANGVRMEFRTRKENKNDVEFFDGRGSVLLLEEKGTVPEGQLGRDIPMTKEEIKRLPRKERPRSIESRDYVQYRVKVGGELPVKQEDVVAALTILSGYTTLIGEGIDQVVQQM